MTKAMDYIPIDTSALRDTGQAELTLSNDVSVEVTMRYGGTEAPYAGSHYFGKLGHLFQGDRPISIRTSRFSSSGRGLATGTKAKYARAYYAARKERALTKRALPWLQLAFERSGMKNNLIRVFVNQFK